MGIFEICENALSTSWGEMDFMHTLSGHFQLKEPDSGTEHGEQGTAALRQTTVLPTPGGARCADEAGPKSTTEGTPTLPAA